MLRCVIVLVVLTESGTRGSTVPCKMDVKEYEILGEKVAWEVTYENNGFGNDQNCEYQLEQSREWDVLMLKLEKLYLVSESGECSAVFEINGERFCHLPQTTCIVFRLSRDNKACHQFQNPLQCDLKVWEKFPLSVSVISNGASESQKTSVQFIYQYYNCSKASTMPKGRVGNKQWSTWPDFERVTHPADETYTTGAFTIIIPLIVLLIVLLAALLSLVILWKRQNRKRTSEDLSLDIRKQSTKSTTSNEYGTIETQYENIGKLKRYEKDGQEETYNIIYQKSS